MAALCSGILFFKWNNIISVNFAFTILYLGYHLTFGKMVSNDQPFTPPTTSIRIFCISWIKFGADVYDPQRMNPNKVGNPPDFSSCATSCSNVSLFL